MRGSEYGKLGVDVRKRGIEVFERILDTVSPHTFCPVVGDPTLRGSGVALHSDGAGSKPLQAYLHWKETGDFRWFEGLARDVIAMNLDDLVCLGPLEPLGFVDYIALNSGRIPKTKLLSSLAFGFRKCLNWLRRGGLNVPFLGGETADLPDQIRILDISGAMGGRVKLSKLVRGEKIGPEDVIIGLRSGGRARYERGENSGVMCNGITLARYVLMRGEYTRKYPELVDVGKRYRGRFFFDEYSDELGMTVGEAILSPTRIFAPVVLEMIEELEDGVKGLIHNTGGGLTKCLRVGKNVLYEKNDLPDPDPIFTLIQREGRIEWREMFEVFNMGVGFEVIVERDVAEEALSISDRFGLEGRVIGRCEKNKGGNKVIIRSKLGDFEWVR